MRTRIISPSARAYALHYAGQRGRGGQFGQIYSGARFPQRGGGIGTFLAGIVRGISSLIQNTPDWVKTGAKIVGTSALRNFADYGSDVQAGADPRQAKKRAVKSTLADIFEEGSKKMRGSGAKKKKKCCKKLLGGGGSRRRMAQKKRKPVRRKSTRRRAIRRRTKFDLLSV